MTNILHLQPSHITPPAPTTSDRHHAAAVTTSPAALHTHRSEVIPSLDGIRAISVLIVVVGHCGLQALVPGGFGVTIFFFVSGFLISTLMMAEHDSAGAINVPQFYARRVFRLMPPLVLTLTIAYGLVYAGVLGGGITGRGLAAQLLYFANYYGLFFDPGNTVPDGTGILWSLAVEEHFYIVYPLLMAMLLALALRPRTIGALLATLCLAVLAWRIHLVYAPGFFPDRTYYASDTRIDSIAYGCILALVMNPVRQRPRLTSMSSGHWAVLAGAASVLLFTLLYRSPVFRETARYSLQGLALMPLFYCAIRFADAPVFRLLNNPWVMTLGTYSYAIYLIHYVVIMTIDRNLPTIATRPYLLLPITILISIGFAAASDRFIEPYFRQLRRNLRPTPTGSQPALAGCT
ncbi:MAG: acyltransferase [Bradyrhizobium sp.]